MPVEDRIDSLLLLWQEHQAQGRDLAAAELCRDCPELAAQLNERTHMLRQMNALLRTTGETIDEHAGTRVATAETGNVQTGSDPLTTTAPPEESAGGSDRLISSIPGYEILDELGRGGMGVVYKARQIKANRVVALKMILHQAHAALEQKVRFQIEAEAIACFQHPNIVQLHDVGEHEGMPFFSLEFCDGGGLDKQLKDQRLAAREAAALLEKLARAMHYAHSRGVVHRDLKPANVLLASPVGSAPAAGTPSAAANGLTQQTPKITDFGLAKRIDTDANLSRTGEVMGTPSYMAPEQAAGETREIGPAADVYALGAILYELLTGRPPFKGASLWDTVQLVVGTEPIAPRQLQPKVPRDLETICLKCLQKKPSGRYGSAAALAEDLRCFQAGEPIQARPAGVAERTVKWARRRPTAAALLAVSVLAAACLLGGGLWFTARLAEKRDEAVRSALAEAEAKDDALKARDSAREAAAKASREATKANRTAQVLTEMFEAPDPLGLKGIPSLKPRAGEPLTVLQMLGRGADKVVHNLNEEPETQAKLMDTIGNVYVTLSMPNEARPLLEKALALRRQALPKNHPDLATSLHNLAWLNHETGDYTAADQLYREALAVRQERADADPMALSTTMLSLAWLLTDMEDFPAAEAMFQGAIDLRVRCLPPGHRDIAVARAGLVAAYLAEGKYLAALPVYQSAMATLRKVEGAEGLAESVDLFQQGVMGRELPPLVRRTLLGLKDDQAVEDSLKRSLDLARRVLHDDHLYVALVLHELALTLDKHHKEAEAEPYYADCVRIVKQYGLHYPKATILLWNYCSLLHRRGKKTQADELLDEALKARRQRQPANHYTIADILVMQAGLADDSEVSRRRQLLREALTMYCQSPTPLHGHYADCVALMAEVFTGPEMYDVACELIRAGARRSEANGAPYLGQAVVALRLTRKRGYRDLGRLQHDKAFDALRGQGEFQKLLAEPENAAGGE